LFRQRLDELVNPRNPLAQLAQYIDWRMVWSGYWPAHQGGRIGPTTHKEGLVSVCVPLETAAD
jgi:hypothetical protein